MLGDKIDAINNSLDVILANSNMFEYKDAEVAVKNQVNLIRNQLDELEDEYQSILSTLENKQQEKPAKDKGEDGESTENITNQEGLGQQLQSDD